METADIFIIALTFFYILGWYKLYKIIN